MLRVVPLCKKFLIDLFCKFFHRFLTTFFMGSVPTGQSKQKNIERRSCHLSLTPLVATSFIILGFDWSAEPETIK